MFISGCATTQKQEIKPPLEIPAKAEAKLEQVPSPKAPQAPAPIEEYFKITRIGGASFLHDEKLIAYYCDKGGRIDIWVQSVEGGEAKQLTHVKGVNLQGKLDRGEMCGWG